MKCKNLKIEVRRLGVVLEPDGSDEEAEGILNPASARDRQGNIVLYTRSVAHGNVSRIGLIKVRDARKNGKRRLTFQRQGFVLEPEAEYELNGAGGQGCEDPRVTFVPVLDKYLMLYTAYGSQGPRIAIAESDDGYTFRRIGLMEFPQSDNLPADDKDAAFFPEPVFSPAGVESIAFYHRPMAHITVAEGVSEMDAALSMPAEKRQSIRIAYIPLQPVLSDLANLTKVGESHLVLSPAETWGRVKVGGGTPPVRIKEGWLSIYHGVDVVKDGSGRSVRQYSAGVIIHDAQRPHLVLYHSESPVFVPETEEELSGTVNNVVFPTGIERWGKQGGDVDTFDVYYGMADFRIGRIRMIIRR